jgi:UDP-glucose 4-epimerase
VSIVVTGGAGFIGANLVRRLCAAGEHVVVVDDLSTGDIDNLRELDVTFLEGTILDPALLDRAMDGARALVHLAARPSVPRSITDPVASHLANASGTVEVLEAARRAGSLHVIVASSSSVYGAKPTLPNHEDLAARPLSPYAASKLAAEAYALAYQESFGLHVLAFRFFNVFGPLQGAGHAYAAAVPAFIAAALAGEPLVVHGDGKQTRDFTYVDTVTEVIADALARGVTSPTPVNLAFGSRTDLLTLIAELEAILGTSVAVEHVETRAGDVRHSQADSSRLQELFPGVVPTALPDALRATVDWFRAQ